MGVGRDGERQPPDIFSLSERVQQMDGEVVQPVMGKRPDLQTKEERRRAALWALSKVDRSARDEERFEQVVRRGQERYGAFAPYPTDYTPKGKWRRKRGGEILNWGLTLPRVAGVGEVTRDQRLEALNRLAQHVTGENPITEFAELDAHCRLMMQVPRAHAVAFHRHFCQAFREWVSYAPCGRGTVGSARKAYLKALQFLEVLKP